MKTDFELEAYCQKIMKTINTMIPVNAETRTKYQKKALRYIKRNWQYITEFIGYLLSENSGFKSSLPIFDVSPREGILIRVQANYYYSFLRLMIAGWD